MKKRLTIDDIYDPDRKINFDGNITPDVIWIDDSHFIQGGTGSFLSRRKAGLKSFD